MAIKEEDQDIYRVFAQFHTNLGTEEFGKREQLGKALIRRVLAVAEAAGVFSRPDANHRETLFLDRQGPYVCPRVSPYGVVSIDYYATLETKPENKPVAIKFDPIVGAFVGLENDPDVRPEPGRRWPKKDAAVVLAETIVRMLSGKIP